MITTKTWVSGAGADLICLLCSINFDSCESLWGPVAPGVPSVSEILTVTSADRLSTANRAKGPRVRVAGHDVKSLHFTGVCGEAVKRP